MFFYKFLFSSAQKYVQLKPLLEDHGGNTCLAFTLQTLSQGCARLVVQRRESSSHPDFISSDC